MGDNFFDGIQDELDKQAEEDRKQREAAMWPPKGEEGVGSTLKGIFLSASLVDTEYSPPPVPLGIFRDTDSGETVKVFLGSALLKRIVDAEPAPGTPIAIRYNGYAQPQREGGREYKDYTIVIADRDEDARRKGAAYWQEVRAAYTNRPADSSQEVTERPVTEDDFKPF